MKSGYVQLDRKILNWEWYEDANTFRVFLHLLLTANHKVARWQGVTIGRGQVLTGRLKLATALHLSEKQIRLSLNKLKTTNGITIKTTNLYSIITICKYNTYQCAKNEKGQQEDQQEDQQEANGGPTEGQRRATNNNDNKNKKNNNINIDKKEIQKSVKVVEVTGKKYLPTDFNGLPEHYKMISVELVKRLKKIDIDSDTVLSLWEIFKIQKLTGDEWHANEGRVYSFFIDWLKFQNFTIGSDNLKNTTNERRYKGNSTNKSGDGSKIKYDTP